RIVRPAFRQSLLWAHQRRGHAGRTAGRTGGGTIGRLVFTVGRGPAPCHSARGLLGSAVARVSAGEAGGPECCERSGILSLGSGSSLSIPGQTRGFGAGGIGRRITARFRLQGSGRASVRRRRAAGPVFRTLLHRDEPSHISGADVRDPGFSAACRTSSV